MGSHLLILWMLVSPFVGAWEGKLNGLPAVEVRVEQNGGDLAGRVAFYFQRRGEDGKWRVEGDKYELPMIGPKIEGKILSFEVMHYKKHGGSELGPNAKFRMQLTGRDEGRLIKVEDRPGEGVILIRRPSRE